MSEIIYKEESYTIMGACFEVYREKGCGFVEPVYQECLEKEFGLQQISFLAQPKLELSYKKLISNKHMNPTSFVMGKLS